MSPIDAIAAMTNALQQPEVPSDTAQARAQLIAIGRLEAALAARQAELVTWLTERDGFREVGATDATSWLAQHLGSRVGARQITRAADAVRVFPHLAAALRSSGSTVGVASLTALTRLVARVDSGAVDAHDPRVVDIVSSVGSLGPRALANKVTALVHELEPEPHRRAAAARRLTLREDRETGMHVLHAELDPHTATMLRGLLEAIVTAHLRDDSTQRTWKVLTGEERFGQAFAELLATRAAGPGRVTMIVHVDADTLRTGLLSAGGVCEYDDGTPLPIGRLRALACEADILPVVLGGDSRPLDVGRARRLATQAQRVAMRARSRTCEWPGCDHPARWCAAHHLDQWDHGGATDLANLAWLCPGHHDLVHHGWRAHRHDDHLHVTPPDGAGGASCAHCAVRTAGEHALAA